MTERDHLVKTLNDLLQPERYGAPAVAAHVASQLGLQHQFVDIDNPA